MLPTIIFLSCVTVAAFLFLLLRIMRWRTIMRHAVKIDVLFTIAALFGSMGTITGMAVAITSGLLLAIRRTPTSSILSQPMLHLRDDNGKQRTLFKYRFEEITT